MASDNAARAVAVGEHGNSALSQPLYKRETLFVFENAETLRCDNESIHNG